VFIIFGISILIWIIVFIRRLTISDTPIPYICYLLSFSGYLLMLSTSEEQSNDGFILFLLVGLAATLGLFALLFSPEDTYAALELRDAEIKPAGKVMLWFAAILFVVLPWAVSLGLFGKY